MKVRTFYDDGYVEGELDLTNVQDPKTQKLFKVKLTDGKVLVRHRCQLTPLDQEVVETIG